MGKWTGAFSPFPDGSGAVDGFAWNPKLSKAYSEGREGLARISNVVGSPADLAYHAGQDNSADPAYEFETAFAEGGATQFVIGLAPEMATADGITTQILDTQALSSPRATDPIGAPFLLPDSTLTEIGIFMDSTPEGAERNAELAVYAFDGSVPTTIVEATRTMINVPAGSPDQTEHTVVLNVALPAGTYIIGVTVDNGTNFRTNTLSSGTTSTDASITGGVLNATWVQDSALSFSPFIWARGNFP